MKLKRISKVEQRDFLNQLKTAVAEKDVETAYKGVFQKYYETTFPSPYGSDGHIEPSQTSLLDEGGGLSLLLEVKFRLDLKNANERAKIVAQAIYYLKMFQNDANQLPNVIVGGDENEIFTVYAPKLYPYLDEDYDWSIAPSSAWRENESLYRRLLEDPNLNVFVFDTRTTEFDINEVFGSIATLGRQDGDFSKLHVSEANIRKVFDEFVTFVFGTKWKDEANKRKLEAQDLVSIFIQSILGNVDTYMVPTKRNVLHLAGGRETTVNGANYDAFFSRYDRKYTVGEIDTITAVADQLIEEVKRRFHGDFWTPTVWADRAIQMMTDDLGEGWRDKYVVWDPAAGTKNLTRDYDFAKLYASTIHQSEIDMSGQYNKNSTAFQYDFLNDDIGVSPKSDPRDLKMPESLFNALKNDEPIVFYTNPPYGQATEQGSTSKSGIADTSIGSMMRKEGMGHASLELYTQFIYRVQKIATDFNLTNVFFFFFNKGFLASPVFGKFTDQLLDQFEFHDGFMLNAGEFQGTSSAWGIIFSNFQLKSVASPLQKEFNFSVERSGIDGVTKINSHTLRRVAKGDTISAWLGEIKLTNEKYNAGKYPRITGGFNISAGKTIDGFLRKDAIGFMHNGGVSVQFSDKYVNLNTTMNFVDHGSSVKPENFERICVTFAARKSILPDASWINDKDIFRRPSDDFQALPEWSGFVHDCVVYSLFHRSSYQTSLRDFDYDGENYDVFNEWFFMPKSEIIRLAEQYKLNDIVYDARTGGERFVYEYLERTNLSPESSITLEKGRELIAKTFAKRYIADQEHPEWSLMSWDAGYYQAYKITTMYKSDFADFMRDFRAVYEKLETKIRQQVYKDKILYK